MNSNLLAVIVLAEDENIQEIYENTKYENDDEFNLLAAEEVLKIFKRTKRICIRNYIEVIHSYSDDDFIKHFRFNRETVRTLIQLYTHSQVFIDLTKQANSRAWKVSPEKTVLVFLWYAGHHSASFRDVSDRFNVCLRTLYDIITRMIDFIETLHSVIEWPSHMKQLQTKRFFYSKAKFPNTIGCIDGSHIKIDKPSHGHTDYCNRKGFYSIVLQGVCNEKKKFISIFIGFPGSTHDARVFKCSTLHEKLQNEHNDFFILGDSAYPLSPYLITPYRDNGHLSPAQKYFNKKLSSVRVHIEHTFGLLKQRFRQLYHVKLQGHKRITKFIRACCILHNIGSDTDYRVLATEGTPLIEEQPDNEPAVADQRIAVNIRNQLCNTLYMSRNERNTN